MGIPPNAGGMQRRFRARARIPSRWPRLGTIARGSPRYRDGAVVSCAYCREGGRGEGSCRRVLLARRRTYNREYLQAPSHLNVPPARISAQSAQISHERRPSPGPSCTPSRLSALHVPPGRHWRALNAQRVASRRPPAAPPASRRRRCSMAR
ncbi:hypothetical protein HYPSUDRAFT_1099723 [Hypholoma sublateritium FD-334 SS-4]|uniref:Uncharacterized protein n=1 Tax=Hypholoma sublateritium (strain FD-334 SS-4) TaxID=945553 RepID=A0A0D2KUP0_HYPSF|nr:hypothetical protein HYPSUDRAFT_1099723 [Hypholoma sublateritium FD-334 SS-4]